MTGKHPAQSPPWRLGCAAGLLLCVGAVLACGLGGALVHTGFVRPPEFSFGIGPIGIAAQTATVSECTRSALPCAPEYGLAPRRRVYTFWAILRRSGPALPRRHVSIHIPLRR